jgi:hypothetical protein
MKNLIATTVLAASSVLWTNNAAAQMPYNVTTLVDTYAPLAGATNVTANRVWSDTSNFIIPVGFSFQMGGKTITNIHLTETNLFFTGSSGIQSGFAILGTSLQDRGYPAGAPSSPIQYKVTGSAGSRVFKLEIKNAGFMNELDKFQTMVDSVNLQVWIYEQNSAVEFRFGPSSITHYADYFDQKVPLGYIKDLDLSTFSFNKFYCLKGAPTSPGMDTLTEMKGPIGFDSYPAAGRVYRFAPKGTTTGIKESEKPGLGKIYPVPAQNTLFIEGKADRYEIYSLAGSVLSQGNLSSGRGEVSVQHLAAGTYLIRLRNADNQVEVQRFIKQ